MSGRALELSGLSAGFRKQAVVHDINLSAEQGSLLVLAGPNGAGKSTLLRAMAGLIKPLGGRVLIDGRDIAGLSRRERARHIAFLPQSPLPPWPFTVWELVSQGRYSQGGFFSRNEGDQAAAERAIAEAGLSGFENRPVTELSGGEYQRVLIARAMAQESSWMLLDEPVNNLDLKHQLMVMELCRSLSRAGKAVVISLHELRLAGRYADSIVLLANGRIRASGSSGEVLRADLLRDVFDLKAEEEWIAAMNS
ncbi:MAG: ABC transporter ATP-binding protein [Treponema sp.]|jgi:iron complex transport system ATP-binding protein|nr:ABC transporter ATP-binding protein [Treponema sp.]